MHPDQAALYRSVLANPHADLPRLVYADWLEENGRAERAEFIRVQIELANSTPADDNYCDLVEREIELRAILEDELRAERADLPRVFHPERERRGFVEGLRMVRRYAADAADRFTEQLSKFAPLFPLCSAHFALEMRDGPRLPFLRCADIARFFSLSFSHGPRMAPAFQQGEMMVLALWIADALRNSDHVHNLRSLDLGGGLQLDDTRFNLLATAETLPGLRELGFSDRRLTRAANSALHSARWREQLTALTQFGNKDSFHSLADGCSFPELHTLSVEASPTEPLAHLLNNLDLYPKLVDVRLGSDGGTRIDALGEPVGHFTRPLRALSLRGNHFRAGDWRRLFNSPGLRSLHRFALDATLVPELAEALAAPGAFPELRHLFLSPEFHSTTALATLARAPVWQSVTKLTLDGSGLRAAGDWRQFFGQLEAPALKHLMLTRLLMHSEGGLALAANRTLAGLRLLTVHDCDIGQNAVRALLAAPHLQNLVALELSITNGGKGLDALTDPSVMPAARRIVLGGKDIPPALADKLRARPGVVIR